MRMAGVGIALVCSFAAWAQTARDLAGGKASFRSNCAFCHGLAGGGGRGPALSSGRLQHGSTEEDIKNVVRNGVPGSTMPAFDFEKEELDALAAYVKSLSGSATVAVTLPGDAVKGRKIYDRTGCRGCHQIGAEGSVFGPELSRIGAARSPDYIRESIVDPSADIPDEYAGVTVITRDGRRITGVRINEDTFTLQMRDASQNFRMFQKDEVQQVIPEKKSLMPAYGSLSQEDLQDLLAYLNTLRGDLNTGAEVKKAGGIR